MRETDLTSELQTPLRRDSLHRSRVRDLDEQSKMIRCAPRLLLRKSFAVDLDERNTIHTAQGQREVAVRCGDHVPHDASS
jgi:hypothetical protein